MGQEPTLQPSVVASPVVRYRHVPLRRLAPRLACVLSHGLPQPKRCSSEMLTMPWNPCSRCQARTSFTGTPREVHESSARPVQGIAVSSGTRVRGAAHHLDTEAGEYVPPASGHPVRTRTDGGDWDDRDSRLTWPDAHLRAASQDDRFGPATGGAARAMALVLTLCLDHI